MTDPRDADPRDADPRDADPWVLVPVAFAALVLVLLVALLAVFGAGLSGHPLGWLSLAALGAAPVITLAGAAAAVWRQRWLPLAVGTSLALAMASAAAPQHLNAVGLA
jgi:hypothetical protein